MRCFISTHSVLQVWVWIWWPPVASACLLRPVAGILPAKDTSVQILQRDTPVKYTCTPLQTFQLRTLRYRLSSLIMVTNLKVKDTAVLDTPEQTFKYEWHRYKSSSQGHIGAVFRLPACVTCLSNLSRPYSQLYTCTDSPARDTCPFLLVKDTPVQILQLHQSRPSSQRHICTDPLAKGSLVQNFKSMRHLDRPAGQRYTCTEPRSKDTPVQIFQSRGHFYWSSRHLYRSCSWRYTCIEPRAKDTPVQIFQSRGHFYWSSRQGDTCTDLAVEDTPVQNLEPRIHLYRYSSQGDICTDPPGKDTLVQIFS
jgi:hypothetical protein